MKLYNSVGLVFVGTLGCGILGAVAGYYFGLYFPGYYHAMYPPLMMMRINTAELGAGNGLQLGLVLGLLTTMALVFIQVWRERGAYLQPAEEMRQEIRELRELVIDLQMRRPATETRAPTTQQYRSADS
jgi:hypothetical protein